MNPAQITEEIKRHVAEFGGEFRPYDSLLDAFKEDAIVSNQTIAWLDSARTSLAVFQAIESRCKSVCDEQSPIQMMKALKNATEVNGMRQAHIKDAVACIKFWKWLESRLDAGDNTLTECSVSDQLEALRRAQKDCVSLSFETIAGAASNGAIIHYKPEPETCRRVTRDDMFLLDSGAQFRQGTTDITRTAHLSFKHSDRPLAPNVEHHHVTKLMREAYTRVLRGHINLARAVFPSNTPGPFLDVLARQPLWDLGLNYNHGTGHGVGHFLNVHEGPQGIAMSARSPSVLRSGLQSGMVLSNEPGFYLERSNPQVDDGFGVRIESLVVVQPAQTEYNSPANQWMCFDTITLVPIQTALLLVDQMTADERAWLNKYHATCREIISPLLDDEERQWLVAATQPI